MRKAIFKVSNGKSLPKDFIIEYQVFDELPLDGYLSNDGYFYYKKNIYQILNEDEFLIKLNNNEKILKQHIEKLKEIEKEKNKKNQENLSKIINKQNKKDSINLFSLLNNFDGYQ